LDWRGKDLVSLLQVGPIPIDDSNGKEIVTKLTTPLKTEKTFYTDSNGRDFLKRASQSAHYTMLGNQIVDLNILLREDYLLFCVLVLLRLNPLMVKLVSCSLLRHLVPQTQVIRQENTLKMCSW
jgi:hypothetical protein